MTSEPQDLGDWLWGELTALLDDDWHLVLYRMQGEHGSRYVVEASGGDGTDGEYVGEGDTIPEALRELASAQQRVWDEERRDYDEREFLVEG